MNGNLITRNYREDDYPILKDMIFALAHDDHDADENGIVMSEAKIQSTVQRNITHPEQIQIRIFEIDHAVAGYALLAFFWSNEHHGLVAILDELYILPTYRGFGIATQFITQLAQNKDYAVIQLEVFKANTKALALYKRLGFEIVDRHFMTKRL